MRKIMLSGCLIAALCFASGCGSEQRNTDAVESAEESNENKAEAKEEAAEDKADAVDADKTKADAEFAVKAADGGMLEVQLAQLAEKKATSQEVKKFAKQMMTDHMKANDELQSLASQKNITLPADMSDDCKKDVDRLSKLSGAEFDKEYMKFMVDDHEDDVDEFKKASNDANDADIKAFAAKVLPVLENHLDMAKKTKETVDKMEHRSSSR
jgi:putative membrane protein